MKLKKNMARLLSLVLVMGTLAGCSNTSSSDSDNKTKSAVEQRKENKLVVHVGNGEKRVATPCRSNSVPDERKIQGMKARKP